MDSSALLATRELARAWQSVLGRLELELNPHNFATWLKGTRAVAFDGATLAVEARSVMACDWLNGRLRVVVERAASQALSSQVAVAFSPPGERPATIPAGPSVGSAPRPTALTIGTVNCAYTFEDYQAARGNQLALEACRVLMESTGLQLSPVVIYGAPGMGKTHLLHALACSAQGSGVSVACLNAEEFANRYLGAFRGERLEEFHNQIRGVRLLIVDDLQNIVGKKGTIDELVNTMEAVQNAGGYIVCASERHPFELGFPERLQSRLAAGLLTKIEPFEAPERRAFVEGVARRKRVALPGWAIDRLAACNAPSVRVLLGCVNVAMALERSGVLTLAALDARLGGLVVAATGCPNEADLLVRVSQVFNVALKDLEGRARDARTSEARAVAVALLQQHGYGLPRLRAAFDGRDKGTLHGLGKRGRALLEADPALRDRLAV